MGCLWIVRQISCCLASAKFDLLSSLGKFFVSPCSVPHENQ